MEKYHAAANGGMNNGFILKALSITTTVIYSENMSHLPDYDLVQ